MKTRLIIYTAILVSVIALLVSVIACLAQIRRYNAVQEEEPGPPRVNHEAYAKWLTKVHGSSFHGNRVANMTVGSHGTLGYQWYRGERGTESLQLIVTNTESFSFRVDQREVDAAMWILKAPKEIVSIRYEYEDGSSFSWNK